MKESCKTPAFVVSLFFLSRFEYFRGNTGYDRDFMETLSCGWRKHECDCARSKESERDQDRAIEIQCRRQSHVHARRTSSPCAATAYNIPYAPCGSLADPVYLYGRLFHIHWWCMRVWPFSCSIMPKKFIFSFSLCVTLVCFSSTSRRTPE